MITLYLCNGFCFSRRVATLLLSTLVCVSVAHGGCHGDEPSAPVSLSVAARPTTDVTSVMSRAGGSGPTGRAQGAVTIVLSGPAKQAKVSLLTRALAAGSRGPASRARSWTLGRQAGPTAFKPLIGALVATPRSALIDVHLRGSLTVPLYRALLDALARDGRRHVEHSGVPAYTGTLTCPAPVAKAGGATPLPSAAPGSLAVVLRPDGLYLDNKRVYAYRAGVTPGRLKRDGDEGYLVDPLFRALETRPRAHVEIVAAPGLTFPSRLLLEIHYTANEANNAARRLTHASPSATLSFSLSCGR